VPLFYRSTRLYNIAASYNGQRGYNLDPQQRRHRLREALEAGRAAER
jgi:hypothetical protein